MLSPVNAPVPADKAALEAAELIRIQYRNMPTAFVGSVVMSTLLVIVMRNAVDAALAVAWLAVMYAHAAGRYLQWRAYRRVDPPAADAHAVGALRGLGLGAVGFGLGYRVDPAVPGRRPGLAVAAAVRTDRRGLGLGLRLGRLHAKPSTPTSYPRLRRWACGCCSSATTCTRCSG
jgi:hypothetical protein